MQFNFSSKFLRTGFFIGTISLIALGYENCGQLVNSGASNQITSASTTQANGPQSLSPSPTPVPTATPVVAAIKSQLIQYNDNSSLVAVDTMSIKNFSPIQAGDLIVFFTQDANNALMSQTAGVAGCPCLPTDTSGNTYVNVPGTNFYYAANVAAAAAGANTITVNYSAAMGPIEIFFFEFSGMATVTPVDTYVTANTGAAFSSPITTAAADDFILAELDTTMACTDWTNGWTMQMTNHGNCWATLNAPTVGTYTAAGAITGTGVLHMVALKEATTNVPQFILHQTNAKVVTAATTFQVTMRSDQEAGDLNIVAVTWNTGTGTVLDPITDTKGNTYTLATTMAGNGVTESIYYAQNIAAAPAGTNLLTFTFSGSVNAQVTAHEYSGSVTGAASPLDKTNGATGTGTAAGTGNVTTTFPNELIFTAVGEGIGQDVTALNSGYRLLVLQNQNINPGPPWYSPADGVVTSTGTYSNTFTLSTVKTWAALIATFH